MEHLVSTKCDPQNNPRSDDPGSPREAIRATEPAAETLEEIAVGA